MQPLTEDAKRVLTALSDRASDGYSLLNRTQLGIDQLKPVLQSLLKEKLVEVQGDPYGADPLSCYFWVPTSAQGKAAFYLYTA